ncbi:molybdopterin adenylyltransferase [Anditalea andensis]|uniref:Molybdopterin adenylyltransferase n=1 Tax=Anditalea andensis TaxID=1048983 RepID=A0A074L0I1_9BACT|nr:molybdopterin adenylyltransferase [Anditalea andensis]KEO75741.1 molybdopterin adenylyltransferase [Anditalea andensis]
METVKIGIITASDRASAKIYDDQSGSEIIRFLNDSLINPWESDYKVVPDELEILVSVMEEMVANNCCLIITTGGTGPAKRDVTPEATEIVCDKMLPGFGELMRQISLQHVPTAILSRQTAGICNASLIINLPGKPSAIKQCLEAVFPAVPYCIDLIGGPYLECDQNKIKIYRP